MTDGCSFVYLIEVIDRPISSFFGPTINSQSNQKNLRGQTSHMRTLKQLALIMSLG